MNKKNLRLPHSQPLPIFESIDLDQFDLATLFQKFSRLDGCLFLESSPAVKSENDRSRYSYVMAEPVTQFIASVGDRSVFESLKTLHSKFNCTTLPDLPSFQGGLAGFFSYDIGRSIENIDAPKYDDVQMPAAHFGVYDVVLAIDHYENRAWIVSQGWDAAGNATCELAEKRLNHFREIISCRQPLAESPSPVSAPVMPQAPLVAAGNLQQLSSNFSQPEFLQMIQQAIDYIYAGDVFQVNLAQQLLFPADRSATELYLDLREVNPAPFSGYYDLGPQQIVSASPERLVQVQDRIVETRPIKGTRRRTRYPQVDIQSAEQLRTSEKDLAENTMIVDLMRNDLSRVCTDDSVVVTQLCELEKFQSVFHLVSAVQGKLRDECDTFDLLESVLPGGSITGAPKIRAMEIIAELEPSARGAYCGSMGYITPNGDCDFNILIRTITCFGGWWQIPVGGGIVSQSVPESEYQETWTKAAGMLKAITRRSKDGPTAKPNINPNTKETVGG